jgi:septal ring factor EnvC (AmiA/AmiB activator)
MMMEKMKRGLLLMMTSKQHQFKEEKIQEVINENHPHHQKRLTHIDLHLKQLKKQLKHHEQHPNQLKKQLKHNDI